MPTTLTELDAAPTGAPVAQAPAPVPASDDAELVEEELLVAEISIDGMCGVY